MVSNTFIIHNFLMCVKKGRWNKLKYSTKGNQSLKIIYAMLLSEKYERQLSLSTHICWFAHFPYLSGCMDVIGGILSCMPNNNLILVRYITDHNKIGGRRKMIWHVLLEVLITDTYHMPLNEIFYNKT